MISRYNMYHGTDPEGFLVMDGAVIGSEKLIPEAGLKDRVYNKPLVVRDGVQFELNPAAPPNLPNLGNSIGTGFGLLKKQLAANPGTSICYDGLVTVSRKELNSLSPKSRVLGCQPSKNFYGERPITVDPVKYRKRSAGGHLHLGVNGLPCYDQRGTEERHRLVPLLDIFVGNTCVLLDRDPGAAERRQNYGRAGEYRMPAHGLEYRVTSNFWLRNYVLMDLVFGLASIAVSTLCQTVLHERGERQALNLEGDLVEVVKIDKFIKAIDTNSYDMARDNFEVIRPFLVKHLPLSASGQFPIGNENLDTFLKFTELVNQRGLAHFFPQDPMEHWIEGKFVSFTNFLNRSI